VAPPDTADVDVTTLLPATVVPVIVPPKPLVPGSKSVRPVVDAADPGDVMVAADALMGLVRRFPAAALAARL